MQKLMSIDEYLATKFTKDSIPTKRVVLNWIKRGDLLAHKIGRKYYIDTSKGEPLLTQSNHSLLTKTKGLPMYLSINIASNGGEYYRYRNKPAGKDISLGTNRAAAIRAANQANSILVVRTDESHRRSPRVETKRLC